MHTPAHNADAHANASAHNASAFTITNKQRQPARATPTQHHRTTSARNTHKNAHQRCWFKLRRVVPFSSNWLQRQTPTVDGCTGLRKLLILMHRTGQHLFVGCVCSHGAPLWRVRKEWRTLRAPPFRVCAPSITQKGQQLQRGQCNPYVGNAHVRAILRRGGSRSIPLWPHVGVLFNTRLNRKTATWAP